MKVNWSPEGASIIAHDLCECIYVYEISPVTGSAIVSQFEHCKKFPNCCFMEAVSRRMAQLLFDSKMPRPILEVLSAING